MYDSKCRLEARLTFAHRAKSCDLGIFVVMVEGLMGLEIALADRDGVGWVNGS